MRLVLTRFKLLSHVLLRVWPDMVARWVRRNLYHRLGNFSLLVYKAFWGIMLILGRPEMLLWLQECICLTWERQAIARVLKIKLPADTMVRAVLRAVTAEA